MLIHINQRHRLLIDDNIVRHDYCYKCISSTKIAKKICTLNISPTLEMDTLKNQHSNDLLFKGRSGCKLLNFDEIMELDYDEIEELFEYLLILKLQNSRTSLLAEKK